MVLPGCIARVHIPYSNINSGFPLLEIIWKVNFYRKLSNNDTSYSNFSEKGLLSQNVVIIRNNGILIEKSFHGSKNFDTISGEGP